jgi:Rad3-related DNA helicases
MDAVNFILKTLDGESVPIVEMPTGSGKTLVAIISAITYAKAHGKKVLYLSRTNSQQEQVLRELRLLSKSMNFTAMAMQGRINMCPLYMEMEEEAEFSAESLSKMCTARKKRSKEKKDGGCRFFNDGIKDEETKEIVLKSMFSPKDVFSSLASKTICPYESMKYVMREADLVVMPYAYFVNSNMALSTIYNWRSSRESILLVIDEAHNLPEIARESNSMKITMHMVDLSEKEVINEGDPELLPGIHASDFTEGIREAIIESGRVLTEGREEKRIMFRELFDNLVMYLRRSPEDVDYLMDSLLSLGTGVEDKLEQKGRVPVSHAKSLAEKLKFMRIGEDNQYICTVSKDKDLVIEAYCLDPSIMLEPMLQSQSIHLSATISPIELYTDITGISTYSFKAIEDVFPSENLLTVYSKEFTTKYTEFDAEMIVKYGKEIKRITEDNKLKTIVFFPSFNTMRKIESAMPGVDHISEFRGITQFDLNRMLNDFQEKPM